MLNVEGLANLHDVSANHINLAGTIYGHDANLNDVNLAGTIHGHDANLNDVTLSGTITGHDANLNDVTLSGTITGHDANLNDVSVNGDISITGNITGYDAILNDVSVNDMNLTGTITGHDANLNDVSVNGNISITGNISVDGSFNFNEIIQNTTTINNTLLVSTQLDISNQGTGPALKVSQFGVGDDQDVALFNAGDEGDAMKIDSSGNTFVYKDVAISGQLTANGGISADNFSVADGTGNTSINGTLGVTGNTTIDDNLVVEGDVNIKNTCFFNSSTRGLTSSTGHYGTLQTTGEGNGGWSGYSINGSWVFMANINDRVGIYNDMDNRWNIECYKGGGTKITGTLTATGRGTIQGGLTVTGLAREQDIGGSDKAWWTRTDGKSITSIYTNPPAKRFSINAGNFIVASEGFMIDSDRRIKTNIQDIEDIESLDIIRKLKPKKFFYKDYRLNIFNKVYGYIAQEVNEILPECVYIGKGNIPNIQVKGSLTHVENTLYKIIMSTNIDIILEKDTILIIYDEYENLIKANVISHEENIIYVNIYEKNIENKIDILVSGQEVNDFHSMDENKISVLTTSVVQELDRQLQAEKEKTAILQTQYNDLLSRIQVLEL